jgi:opacity protein-like surface antigen
LFGCFSTTVQQKFPNLRIRHFKIISNRFLEIITFAQNLNYQIMKKLFTTLVILLCVYSITFAQRNNKNTVEIGANIGYNEAYVVDPSGYNSSFVTGVNIGFSAEHYFSDRWSIKGKLIYDQKGWGNGYITADDGTVFNGVDFQLNYLTVPIMANWHFGRSRNWYLNFGPYAGFLLSAKETTDNIDVKDAFNTTDFGLALGIGVRFPIADNVKLFIEGDGQGGISNIFKDNAGSSIQNSRSSLNIGVAFALR